MYASGVPATSFLGGGAVSFHVFAGGNTGTWTRTAHMLGKCSTTELHTQTLFLPF